MAHQPPTIQTYHCLCSNLLLTSTHTLSSLPRRSNPTLSPTSSTTNSLDTALILPLPSTPPTTSNNPTLMPNSGYTLLLSLEKEQKPLIIRREDGFEKRVLYRCSRCKLVVGYELQTQTQIHSQPQSEPASMDLDKNRDLGKEGKEGADREDKGEEEYAGKILYLLPAGILSTDFMVGMSSSREEGRKKVREEDVDIRPGVVGVFE